MSVHALHSTRYRSTISSDCRSFSEPVIRRILGASDDLHPYGYHYTTIGLDVSPVAYHRQA
jgi:hypothetical protein